MAIIPLLAAVLFGTAAHSSAQQATEVPFDIDGTTIVVPASVNGHNVRLIFDTGFSGDVVIDATLDLGKPTGYTTLRDFVGEFQAPIYAIKTLKLGDRVIPGKDREAVAQPGAGDFGQQTHVDGLMGLSVIKDSVTEINFQNKKFIFHDDSDDISKRKPDNKKTFLVPMLPIGARAIELPVVTSTGKTLVMALDTGNAFYATTHKDVLERVGMWPSGQEAKFQTVSGVASGAVASWAKTMKDMTVFGVHVPESTWDIIDLPAGDASSDGTVGFGFLQNFNITFDYKRRYVWLENFNDKVGNEPDGQLGISGFYDKEAKAVRVFRVSDGSPADLAGIKKDDLILDIDDNELTNISYPRLRKLLTGPAGTEIRMSISHDGIAKRLKLKLVALVNP